MQRKIFHRSLELLKPGGVVVYSTCSLNPIEDEAVVASVIEDVGGVSAMQIVPLPEWLLQKCQVSKGLSKWQVPHPQFGRMGHEMYESYDDVPDEFRSGAEKNAKKKKQGKIDCSMFPPPNNSEIAKQLKHCGRFLPNAKLDSGGFFVACIRRLKVGELVPRREEGSSDKPKEEIVEKECSGDNPSSGDMTDYPLREGDWICASCSRINFGRRGGSRCFSCKTRRRNAESKVRGDDILQRPLLINSQESASWKSFLDFFGISFNVSPFPLKNVCTMSRARAKEQCFVIVSDGLVRLNISNTWSPV